MFVICVTYNRISILMHFISSSKRQKEMVYKGCQDATLKQFFLNIHPVSIADLQKHIFPKLLELLLCKYTQFIYLSFHLLFLLFNIFHYE